MCKINLVKKKKKKLAQIIKNKQTEKQLEYYTGMDCEVQTKTNFG